MAELKREEIERYLGSVFGAQVCVLNLVTLGGSSPDKGIKGYGYGTPIRVDYCVAGQRCEGPEGNLSQGSRGSRRQCARPSSSLRAARKPELIIYGDREIPEAAAG